MKNQLIKMGMMVLFACFVVASHAQKLKNMNEAKILEITSFKLKEGVTEEDLLKGAEKMQNEFLSNVEGFISRTLTKEEDGIWRDVIFWKDHHVLEETAEVLMKSPAAGPFMSCIDFESVEMKAVEIKSHYQ
ncbi:MAG: hypothetical protein KI790_16220 [Cyclobacteriaceae bacterium]|nr:hypothetical protein [Cyclobacteriaceae bacterium HetDA_MAG_MS6]